MYPNRLVVEYPIIFFLSDWILAAIPADRVVKAPIEGIK
jgi:hypothetical protein